MIAHNDESRSEAIASLRAELYEMPKVDLHRHLEGSLRIQTLVKIAREHGIDLPSYDIEYLRPLVTMANEEPDFNRFIQKFQIIRRFYTTEAAIKRVAYEAVADAANDNIKYLELRFNPVALSRVEGFPLDQVTDWVCNTVAQAKADSGIEVNLILQIGREESVEIASQIANIALAHRDNGVVGLDLAGHEAKYPARRFADVFRRVGQQGLGVTVHAGEIGGAENVREAIELLGARRIGHGVRAVEDSDVVQVVRRHGVTLEVCPTSNLLTGVVRGLWQHPLPDLLALNLRVTINTDDPSIFDTTITDEYMTAILAMGVTLEQIKHTILTGIAGSFQPPDQQRRMAEWFRKELELI
jgi:adenosine deaminase